MFCVILSNTFMVNTEREIFFPLLNMIISEEQFVVWQKWRQEDPSVAGEYLTCTPCPGLTAKTHQSSFWGCF